MTDDLRSTLLAYFAIVPSACADMVASDLGLGQREVQEALIQMDDDGDLLMKNGWYPSVLRASVETGIGIKRVRKIAVPASK